MPNSYYAEETDVTDDAPTGLETMAALGWTADMANAVHDGDTYRADLLVGLTQAQQRDLRANLARRGLCLITEGALLHVEKIGGVL